MRLFPSTRRAVLRLCLFVSALVLCAAGANLQLVLDAKSVPEPVRPAIASTAQADAVCAKCHADITRRYLQTPHAAASGDALAKLIPGVFTQPAAGVTYTVNAQDGEAFLHFSDAHNPELHGTHRLDSYLGSGHLGVTYLYSTDNYLFESPVAYYTHLARYDMKPGLAGLAEGAPSIPVDATCLRCHMSGVAAPDPGTHNRYTGPAFRTGGVTCESCHGDASAHVRTAGKAPVVNPAKLTAERRDSVCINCHLEGDVSVEKNHRTALDFRPGDAISQYLSYFVYADAGANARSVSEVEQFALSRCKRTTGDNMSCANCHDPHSVPSASERVSYYRAKCLTCHGSGAQGIAFAAAHHPENPDCTSCHMPKGAAEDIPHVAWTDHRILARPNAAPELLPASPDAPGSRRLLPVFSPDATSRDLALAVYSAVANGHTEDGAQAYALLNQAVKKDSDDVQALNALGTLTNMKGDGTEAGRLFSSVLALDPKNRPAAVNLAVLKARSGDLAEARALLQRVFDRNQDLPPIAANLAAIDCLQGDAAAARATLETALRFNPGSRDLRQRLAETATCGAPAP